MLSYRVLVRALNGAYQIRSINDMVFYGGVNNI